MKTNNRIHEEVDMALSSGLTISNAMIAQKMPSNIIQGQSILFFQIQMREIFLRQSGAPNMGKQKNLTNERMIELTKLYNKFAAAVIQAAEIAMNEQQFTNRIMMLIGTYSTQLQTKLTEFYKKVPIVKPKLNIVK